MYSCVTLSKLTGIYALSFPHSKHTQLCVWRRRVLRALGAAWRMSAAIWVCQPGKEGRVMG